MVRLFFPALSLLVDGTFVWPLCKSCNSHVEGGIRWSSIAKVLGTKSRCRLPRYTVDSSERRPVVHLKSPQI